MWLFIHASDNSQDIPRFIVSQLEQSIRKKKIAQWEGFFKELKEQIIHVLAEKEQGIGSVLMILVRRVFIQCIQV